MTILNKSLLLIFIIFSLNSCKSQNVKFTDSNLLNALLTHHTSIDLNDDKKISFDEALLITKLNLTGKNIKNLEGLEFFTNLKILDCSYNYIDTIDLKNLLQLEEVTSISSYTKAIKVDGLTNLKSLISSSNFISELDLTGLKQLETLRCYNNNLQSLNTEGLENLVELRIYSNHLKSLEIRDLPRLLWVYCNTNEIETLTIEKVPNLELFAFGQNKLKSIDLGQARNIKWLYCQQNSLTELDLSALSSLERALCDDNNLTSINLKNGIAEKELSLLNNPNLKIICSDESDQELLNLHLKTLGISDVQIKTDCK